MCAQISHIGVPGKCKRDHNARITAATANYNRDCQLYLQLQITTAIVNHDCRNINAEHYDLARCGDDFLYAVGGSAFCVVPRLPKPTITQGYLKLPEVTQN